jgi:predicted heme/steroid binding protein
MRTFTKEKLKKYDGREGSIYVAYDGKVYDVSSSFIWKKGKHQVTHHAGCDLTEALKEAPHGPEMLERYPIVGELLDSE